MPTNPDPPEWAIAMAQDWCNEYESDRDMTLNATTLARFAARAAARALRTIPKNRYRQFGSPGSRVVAAHQRGLCVGAQSVVDRCRAAADALDGGTE